MSNDYDVGYRRPPKATRFEPGKSGNPKGRPKGSKNLSADLKEVLDEIMTVKEAGKTKRISKQRAMVMSLMARAIKGDVRATNTLFAMILRLLPEEQGEDESILHVDDLKLLQEFEESILVAARGKDRHDG